MGELVVMVASLMALNALAIDVMLPALGGIAEDFAVTHANDQQLVVIAYILGFGFPQLAWGPLSDRFGRRPMVFVALLGYSIAGCVAAFMPSFELLLGVRFVQGVFAAGCRVVAVAVVRDRFVGSAMAKVMSLVMTVFMVVPITAPMLGQGLLLVASWEAIFYVLAAVGTAVLLWTGLRLRESLPVAQRRPLKLRAIAKTYREVLKTRVTLGYMLASGILFAALFSFLSASEQIFREVFDEGERFVFWFAGIAIVLSATNFANSRLVRRYGMRRLSHGALIGFTVLSAVLLLAIDALGEHLWLFFPLFSAIFALFGLIGANFNSLAMEPLGKVAGTASAAYGFATTTVSGSIGGLIGRAYDGTTRPLLLGYVALGVVCLLIVLITERGRLFQADRSAEATAS
ncbi:MAG: multidrug effflux MFS transporter [Myxococcota bacterium]